MSSSSLVQGCHGSSGLDGAQLLRKKMHELEKEQFQSQRVTLQVFGDEKWPRGRVAPPLRRLRAMVVLMNAKRAQHCFLVSEVPEAFILKNVDFDLRGYGARVTPFGCITEGNRRPETR